MRPSWDEYFLAIADVVKTRAACTRRQVGAIVVKDNRIVGTGYNGAKAGEAHCAEACPRGRLTYEQLPSYGNYSNCIAVHAEANAILQAVPWTYGATLYSTDEPCAQCESLIVSAGIARTVTPERLRLLSWADSEDVALD